jgi:hypothetical protein
MKYWNLFSVGCKLFINTQEEIEKKCFKLYFISKANESETDIQRESGINRFWHVQSEFNSEKNWKVKKTI